MVAQFASRCTKCPTRIKAGEHILYERAAGSRHVVCPAKPASAAPIDLAMAPFEVRERWEACSRAAFDQQIAAVIGETRRYEKNLPTVREGAEETPEPGVYVVVGASRWRYQNAEDNEDMGDMQGANWSGQLYLRRATAEEADRDGWKRFEAALPKILAAADAFLHRMRKADADREVAAAAQRDGYMRTELQFHHDFRQCVQNREELWHGKDRDYNYRVRYTVDGAEVFESHDYIYDWDLPIVYVGPRALLERYLVAEAMVGLGWSINRLAKSMKQKAKQSERAA